MATAATAESDPGRSWRLPKVPWRSRDALVVYVVSWILLQIVLTFALYFLGSSLPAARDLYNQLLQGDPGAVFILYVANAIGSFALIGYYVRKRHAHLSDLGLSPFNPFRAIGYLVAIYIGFLVLVAVVFYLVQTADPHFNVNQAQTNVQEFTSNFSVRNLFALVIIPPLIEETTFRGFMFPAFARRYGVVIGALITSVLFGVAHLQLNVFVYTFILSLLLCWLYTRIGSIIPGMLVHMINNYVAYLAQLHK